MIALGLCVGAFIACFLAGRHSFGRGLLVLFVFGYFYGILRANLITTISHFIFDAGLLGLYLSLQWNTNDPAENRRIAVIRMWVLALVCWPLLMVFLPFQPLLVSLVGLRGNMFMVPLIFVGARLKSKDLRELSLGLAILNLVAFGFALAEYFKGVPAFYPASIVTQIIYSSADVAGGFFRIPAIFSSAHAYGGTMVNTLPYIVGLWIVSENRRIKLLAIVSMAAAMLGVLMSATRTNFVMGVVIVTVTILTTKMNKTGRLVFMTLIAIMGVVAVTNTRFARFKTLGDTDAVEERIAGSVNLGFFEILSDYPMGNGLGGGGSSIPYFLEGQVRNPIGMENEYARILAEQGIIGFLLWIGFVLWFLSRAGIAFARGPWLNTRRLVWSLCAFALATSFMGVGMLTSIPGTVLTLLGIGWTSTRMAAESSEKRDMTRRDETSRPDRWTVAEAYPGSRVVGFQPSRPSIHRALGPQ